MFNDDIPDKTAWSALEVGLPVDDIFSMRRFYVEGLGFAPAGHCDLSTTHIEAFRFGNCLLKLTYFLDKGRRPKPRETAIAPAYITLRVSDLDGLVERCQATGVELPRQDRPL